VSKFRDRPHLFFDARLAGKNKWGLSLFFALLLAVHAAAKEAVPAADDPALEQRVMAVAAELRCLVCQNQTIADSNADLAVDLRNQIREQLKRGASERDIIDFMVARYGDFVLFRPPVKSTTLILWFGPFALLVAALVLLYRHIARRRAPEPELGPAERERAAKLLE
jgi:cytochrome c-type biogenesis protein CcmH